MSERSQSKIEELNNRLTALQDANVKNHQEITAILNALIERKRLSPDPQMRSAYVDFKMMLSHYILSMHESDSDYDELNVSHIVKKMNGFSVGQRLHLLELFKRELLIHGYQNESRELERPINENHLELLKSELSFMNMLKWLSIKSSYKLRYLLYLIGASFLIPFIALLPSYNENFALFTFRQKDYSDLFLLNHFDNVIILILNLDQDVYVECNGTLAVIILAFAKVFFGLFIVNFVFKKITNHINLQ